MTALLLAIAIAEVTIFAMAAVSVAYVLLFAAASHLPARRTPTSPGLRPRFLLIIPAYAEDAVIDATVDAALAQTYAYADVCVVADSMNPSTVARLAQRNIRLVTATYTDSTKGKALRLAMAEAYDPGRHTHVLLLDADNLIAPDLLARLAPLCMPSHTAIQLHRTAKNLDTPIAVLDATSEEINNSIFRRGHNRLNMSAALIGSGICFEAQWFAKAVAHLRSAGEDKELERQLLLDGHSTIFADDLFVLDEKVRSADNFGSQRRRWLAAQLWALGHMLRALPQALAPHSPALRLNYLDKTLQQALIPRSLLMALTAAMLVASVILAIAGLSPWMAALRWAMLDVALDIAIILAIPPRMFGHQLAQAAAAMPSLVWQMVCSLFHLRGASHNFLHTRHGQT